MVLQQPNPALTTQVTCLFKKLYKEIKLRSPKKVDSLGSKQTLNPKPWI